MKKIIKSNLRATSCCSVSLLVALVLLIASVTSTFSFASSQYVRSAYDNSVNHKLVVDIASLKQYVKSGEQALELKNWAGALSWLERSQALLASFPDDIRNLFDIVAIRARLEGLRLRIKENDSTSMWLDAGVRGIAGPFPAHPAKVFVESERTKVAAVGAVFDFPIDLNDKVLDWVHQFTTKKRNFMEQTLSRASQYLPMVHQIFAEECVPQDLAYLAVIESGFINSASSCANAVGMWQFMRSTGHIYGLSGNTWVEERRDPVKATRAAAKYLKQLYTVSGDWYLALVGYNAGPSAADRAIHNLGTRNFWDMHRSRWLRNQTKNYVPELCAAILIGRFPECYGFKVKQLAPYTYDTVEVDRMTSLPALARYSDNDVNKLKELNPELLRNTTPPGKYILRVPPGMGVATTRALANIPDDQRLDFMPYSIAKKDKLSLVAERFNLSTDDLLHINNINKDQFLPGLVIKVPPPLARSIASVKRIFKDERTQSIKDRPLMISSRNGAILQTLPSVQKKRLSILSNFALSTKPVSSPVFNKRALALVNNAQVKPKLYIVKRGDNLFSIASRYGLDLKTLKKLNCIKLAEIHVGQRLYLK